MFKRNKRKMTRIKENIIGNIYNRLTVLKYVGKLKPTDHDTYYLCECSCGKTQYATKYQLKHDIVKSCGCLHTETLINRNYKHGMSKDPRYKIACSILNRVNSDDPKSKRWYKDKGIKCLLGNTPMEVCFQLMKIPGYFDGATIDRIDPNDDYTIFHPEHGFKEWIYYDPVLKYKTKALGNLRWISGSDNTRRHAKKDVNTYETKPVTKYFFKAYCEKHNIDFNDYIMIFSGKLTPGNKLKKYYFKRKK